MERDADYSLLDTMLAVVLLRDLNYAMYEKGKNEETSHSLVAIE